MKHTDTLQHYLATLTTDFNASIDFLAEDLVWTNMVPDNVPFGGIFNGKQEVLGYFGELAESFVIGDYPWDEFEAIESGNTVVLVGYEKDGKAIPTGKVFDLPFVWVVKFNEEGKINYLREHNDTAAISDAFKA